MLRLSKDDMRRLWMLHTRQEPLRADCQVSRSDGPDIASLAEAEMRMWYLHLLAEGPAGWLPTADLSAEAVIEEGPDNSLTIKLPEKCVRPLAVKLEGWERPAVIVAPGSREALLQTNPFSRSGPVRPVAVLASGGRELEIYAASAGATKLESLECVADTGEDLYVFREDALATIGPYFAEHNL